MKEIQKLAKDIFDHGIRGNSNNSNYNKTSFDYSPDMLNDMKNLSTFIKTTEIGKLSKLIKELDDFIQSKN